MDEFQKSEDDEYNISVYCNLRVHRLCHGKIQKQEFLHNSVMVECDCKCHKPKK